MQLKHLLTKKGLLRSSEKALTLFERLLKIEDCKIKGLMLQICKQLLNPGTSKINQTKWEIDCKKELSYDWNQIYPPPVFSTNVTSIHLHSFKLEHRWYTVPLQLNHINKSNLPNCWWNCGLLGNYINCWWECSLIQTCLEIPKFNK